MDHPFMCIHACIFICNHIHGSIQTSTTSLFRSAGSYPMILISLWTWCVSTFDGMKTDDCSMFIHSSDFPMAFRSVMWCCYLSVASAATAADESDLSAEPGKAWVQFPGAQETRRGKHDHEIAAEAQNYTVSWPLWNLSHQFCSHGQVGQMHQNL